MNSMTTEALTFMRSCALAERDDLLQKNPLYAYTNESEKQKTLLKKNCLKKLQKVSTNETLVIDSINFKQRVRKNFATVNIETAFPIESLQETTTVIQKLDTK